ncbi:MAG: hypothetical protein GY913_22920 [Proteobacteria bacterium]|nr:hypothetical protein [Pseudomonadota bacterium]MCP4919764.1 hypothetical protein [Pseudomonadota bacterium]
MKLWSRWVGLLGEREPALGLALFRIALGLCALYTIGIVVHDGIVELIWMDAEYGGYRKLSKGPWLVELLGGMSPEMTWAMVIGSLVTAALFTIGLGGRFSALAALWLFMGASDLNGQSGGSYDELLTCGIFLCVLGPSTATLSVDCRIRSGLWHDPTATVPAWVRWLGIFQVILAYWSTGMQKLSAYWTPVGGYSALFYILQQPSWHRFEMTWVAPWYPLTQVVTALVWVWEAFAPIVWLSYWFKRHPQPGWRTWVANYRWVFFGFGVMTHLGVFALMEVGSFTWVTLTFYLCFVHPDEWKRAWAWCRARVG